MNPLGGVNKIMTLKIKMYSDYVCPYCFLAKGPLAEAVEDKDAEVEWGPFELRPYPAETLRPEMEYVQNAWKSSILPQAEKLGQHMILPELSPQPYTYLAHEGYQFAKEQGRGNEYNLRVIRAFFQEGKNIGDIEVLADLAQEVGLDRAEYKEALETRRYQEAHKSAIAEAASFGIGAVPTFIIGTRIVQGLRNKESLEEIIVSELKKQASSDVPDPEEGAACGIEGC